MAPLRVGVNALYLIPGGVGGTEIYLRGLLAEKQGKAQEARANYELFQKLGGTKTAGWVGFNARGTSVPLLARGLM